MNEEEPRAATDALPTDSHGRLADTSGSAHPFLSSVIEQLEWLERANEQALAQATDVIWNALRADHIVHVAGSGHSTLFALETFFRAGGLASVKPMWHPMLMPLHGARLSTVNERLTGIGPELVRSARIGEGDVVVVFSHSGVNPVPVEIAETSRSHGADVIAVLSLEHNRSVPSRHEREVRLPDVADIVIDTGGPVGDASYAAVPGARMVAPLSTLLGVYAWNAILARLSDRAADAGVELPIWVSMNVPDGDSNADSLTQRYASRIPEL